MILDPQQPQDIIPIRPFVAQRLSCAPVLRNRSYFGRLWRQAFEIPPAPGSTLKSKFLSYKIKFGKSATDPAKRAWLHLRNTAACRDQRFNRLIFTYSIIFNPKSGWDWLHYATKSRDTVSLKHYLNCSDIKGPIWRQQFLEGEILTWGRPIANCIMDKRHVSALVSGMMKKSMTKLPN